MKLAAGDADAETGGAAAVVAVAASGCAGASISQSQPSLMQVRKFPCLVRFSTMKGAPHFGHGSLSGSWGGGEIPLGGRRGEIAIGRAAAAVKNAAGTASA